MINNASAIQRMRDMGWSDERILTALGRPDHGYGPDFATEVIDHLAAENATIDQAIGIVLSRRARRVRRQHRLTHPIDKRFTAH